MVIALGTGIALPAIPVLAKSFDVGFGVASFVITAYLLGGLVGSLPTGWMIDRFGRGRILIAGPIITAVTALLVITAQGFPELLLYRFLGGWASLMWLMARLAGISQRAEAGQRGRQVSWMFGMDNVGHLAGPLVGGFIAAAWGPRAPFAAYAVLALLALIPTIKYSAAPAARRAAERAAVRTISLREIILPRLSYFGVSFFSAVARGPLFGGMIYLYATYAYELDAPSIGLLATASSVITLPIGFGAGWLMDRFGRKVTMVPGFLGVAITMLLLAGTAFMQMPLPWFLAAFLTAVAAQGLTGGSVQTVGADVAPPEARGLFLGMWRFVAQIGTSLSPMAFAFLADHLGYGSSFIFVAVAASIVVFLLIALIPETRKAPERSLA
ncbi:MAG: putative family arabinose efflux permease [Chloroflexi bacterium]|nr:putative family arabinose efflux permease [Chloroflexota bacterium]